MATSDIKITPHLTDAKFKASLDECNNYLAQHVLALLEFHYSLQRDLENLDPEDFDIAYTDTQNNDLAVLLTYVADVGRNMLDRLTAHSCLLTARRELRCMQKQNRNKQ